MSLTWAHGHATTSTARILFRGTTSGTLIVVAGGRTYSASIDTAINDGTAVLDLKGLNGPTRFTAALGADVITGLAKVMPRAAPYDIVWLACQAGSRRLYAERLLQTSPAAAFALGDTPYTVGDSAPFGNITKTTIDDSYENFCAWHRFVVMGEHHGWGELAHGCPVYRMADDHEWAGGDWDHSVTWANWDDGIPGSPSITQTDVDAHFDRGNRARLVYHAGNPQNTYAGATAEKPSSAEVGTPTANYPPTYYRLTIGPAEFFVLDPISHRDPKASPTTMLGATQTALLLSALSTSTATFKIIVSTKTTDRHPDYLGNTDGFLQYITNRDEILSHIHNNVTGCLWIAGDQHYPHVITRSVAAGDSWDHLCVVGCPIGVQINNESPNYGKGQVPFARGTNNAINEGYFGRLRVTDTYLEPQIVDIRGRVIWRGRVMAGENKLTYPSGKTA